MMKKSTYTDKKVKLDVKQAEEVLEPFVRMAMRMFDAAAVLVLLFGEKGEIHLCGRGSQVSKEQIEDALGGQEIESALASGAHEDAWVKELSYLLPENLFCAGASLVASSGGLMGGVGLVDTSPCSFSVEEQETLRDWAAMLAQMLEHTCAVSERNDEEGRLREFARVVEKSADVVFITDRAGTIEYANPAAERVTGYTRAELVGNTPQMLKSGLVDPATYKELWTIITSGKSYRGTLVNRKKDGSVFYLDQTITPIKDEQGRVVKYVSTGRDITDRRKVEAALRRNEALLKQAQRIAHLGHWHWNIQTNELVWSDEVYCIFGLTPQAFGATYDAFLERVHPADRHLVEHSVETALEGASYDLEHRIVRPDGEERVVHERGEVTYEGNQPIRMTGIVQDITDRKRIEERLRQAKEEAEEMNRLKSVFLTNMSHEIRTPLTAIIGFTDLLAIEITDERQELLQLVNESGRRLLDTVDSVLNLAQLESGTLSLQMEPIDVVESAIETAELFQHQAEKKGLSLVVEVPEDAVVARVDRSALDRILMNLISNAIKFTESGEVKVIVEIEKEQARIAVVDTGVGISNDFQPRLFGEFQQESAGLTRDYEGCGLGLAIAKRLVELMGGMIHVESEKGRGSTFSVSFALSKNRVCT